MKILIIANGLIGEDPSPSGGDVRFFQLAKQWQEKGHEVGLLSSKSAQTLIDHFGLKSTLHILPGNSKTVGRNSFILRAFQALFFLPSSLNNFTEGIVYTANDSVFDVFSAVRLKLRHRKSVQWSAVVHWLPPFPPWKRKQSTLLNSTLFFINERISIWLASLLADKILPVSETTAIQLQEAGINMKKVFPVKCGVNYQEIRQIAGTVTEKKYDAVFMKRIQPVKGIFDLIDIWKKVVALKKDAQLVIIGDEGEEAETVKNLIQEAGIEKNVTFTGYIYDSKIKFQILSSAKLFLLPSYEENWAISLGEALCCGVPAIAYDLKELTHIWKDNTVWIPLGNTQSFADKILDLIENPDLRMEYANKSLEFIKQLDWEPIAEEELRIISEKTPSRISSKIDER